MSNTLQQKMFGEMEQKDIFKRAQEYAFDYADAVRGRNVFPTPDAVADLEKFMEALPESTGNAADVIEQLHRYGSPASVAQTGGRYYGFVNGGVIPASLAARWLSDFWDQNTALFVMSPIAAKLEDVCESWLRALFTLPEKTVAGFVSGTSSAILCGLAAARYRVFQNSGWDINTKGFYGAPRLRIVAGCQAHASVVKGIALLGFGTDTIEYVKTDDQGRIVPSEIPELDEKTILILQAGNVASGAFDPFDEICERAVRANAWVHIDGAFGLWAAASERLSHLTRGMERAHSFSVDGHKTLNAPYDSGIVLTTDHDALVHALHAAGSYIVYSENRDGMLYTPEMSRRARVVELWAALKYLGRAGVDELVYGLHERAVQMARALEAEGFQVRNDVVFNQVLVSCGDDALTERTMGHIQRSGECWAGGAEWDGKKVIRVSVCSWATTEDDITRSVRAFVSARERAAGES
jgi:glutamate/tyrosine decarboxylase-like PLP-dependent enzyme